MEKQSRKAQWRIQSRILQLIKENKRFPEICKTINKEFLELYPDRTEMHPNTIRRYYNQIRDEINELIQDDVKTIRNQKILALERDMEEAYNNYQQSLTKGKSFDVAHWWNSYIKIKELLDKYYPNKLEPEKENQSLSINISYEDAKKNV